MGKKKVIIDTNVLISALGWGGKTFEVVDLGFSGAFRWIISKAIFKELVEALNYPKLDFIRREEKEAFISSVSETVEFVEVSRKLEKEFVDPRDSMFLECALEVDADYLVSGDKRLLSLAEIGKTKIISVADFLLEIKQ